MTTPERADVEYQIAREALARRYLTANEIMTGHSPLTQEEIRLLIELRPERYTIFRRWAR